MTRALSYLLLASAALSLAACSATGEEAVHDLQAIHGVEDGEWTPAETAEMEVPPDAYVEEDGRKEGYRIGARPVYEIEDHHRLEIAILDKIAAIDPEDLDAALQATGTLTIALLHDEIPATRIKSAAILSHFAGHWVSRGGVRMRETPPEGDLAAAVDRYRLATLAVDQPDYVDQVSAALEQIDEARIDDPLVAARLVNGMARRIERGPVQVTGEQIVQRTAVRTALAALEAGMKDADPEVADACWQRYQLLSEAVATAAADAR